MIPENHLDTLRKLSTCKTCYDFPHLQCSNCPLSYEYYDYFPKELTCMYGSTGANKRARQALDIVEFKMKLKII